MGSFSIWHWLIVLLVVVLIFGTKKLKNMGSDLGAAVKGFKDGVKGEEEKSLAQQDKRVFRYVDRIVSKVGFMEKKVF